VELWFVSAIFFIVWLIMAFGFHKTGMVHVLLMFAIAIFVVQVAAYRKARYHRRATERNGPV